MKLKRVIRKTFASLLQGFTLKVAESTSQNACFIFHQEEIPDAVKALNQDN